MPPDTSQRSDLDPTNPQSTLSRRVKARVAQAERLLENHPREANGNHKELRSNRSITPSASLSDNSAAHREVQSLHNVYSEMRAVYRSYRRQTGTPAVPELRSAVQAFKRGPSLTSLVHVASFLDERKLLAW